MNVDNSERKRQVFLNFLCSMSKKMVNGLNIPWDVHAIYLLKFENSSTTPQFVTMYFWNMNADYQFSDLFLAF